MSLDFNLIDQALDWSVQQLQRRQTTSNSALAFLDDFLLPDLLHKLDQRLMLPLAWVNETIEDGSHIYPNRQKINWESESVIEELHTVFELLTPEVNKIFQRNNKFLCINIWKDSPGYQIGKHTDNSAIDVAIQIYLDSGDSALGTEFYLENQTVQARYFRNSGYIMDNQAQIPHSMQGNIPQNHHRLSVYAIWKNE